NPQCITMSSAYDDIDPAILADVTRVVQELMRLQQEQQLHMPQDPASCQQYQENKNQTGVNLDHAANGHLMDVLSTVSYDSESVVAVDISDSTDHTFLLGDNSKNSTTSRPLSSASAVASVSLSSSLALLPSVQLDETSTAHS